MTLKVEQIAREDYDCLAKLLSENALLTDDLEGENKKFFAFCDDEGWRMGVGGLELYGNVGLLRSFMTVSAHRGEGHGAKMIALLIAQAKALGAKTLYLFTENAAGFFAKQGFKKTDRDDAPNAIKSSDQFRLHCGDEAEMMKLDIP